MVKQKKDLHQQLKDKVLSDPEARSEYEAFKLQLELAQQLRQARQNICMTQEEVADKMDTKKTVVARLEAAGGRNKHSPSLATVFKLANVLGYKLKITLIPKKKKAIR